MKTFTPRQLRRGAIGFAGIVLVIALAACNSDADGATPSATPDPSGTPGDASPSPSATPDDSAGDVLTGVFRFGFEGSGFFPDAICPGAGPVYWVTWDAFDLGAALETATGVAPFSGGMITTYRASLEGGLSDLGSYGHLGAYERELTVTGLVSAELASDCDDIGGGPVGPVDAGAVAAYEAARALWERNGLTSYEFTLQRNCFCLPEFRGPFAITVVDGEVSEALYEGGPAEDGTALTVAQVFDEIQQALNRGVLTELSYNAVDGHPETVRLDLSAIAADGGLSLDLLDLTAID